MANRPATASAPTVTREALTEEVSLGVPNAPGGTETILPSGPPRQYDLKADPKQEYVAGGYFAPLGDYVRTLPAWIDPTERDFGIDVYRRMVETDPQVASCVEVYKASVLADGWQIRPAQDTDEAAPPRAGKAPRRRSSPEAEECAEFCRDCLVRMSKTPFDLFLRQMLDACFEGHKVAEKVLAQETRGRWAGRLVLDRIKMKPQKSVAFVQDAYDNLVGILGLLPNVPFYGMWPAYGFLQGDGLTLLPGPERDSLQKNAPAILPRSKFAVLTWDGQDGSPQGRSLLRRAFTPWWWKENCYAIWGKFISKHADPSLVGTVAPNAMPVQDPSGAVDGQGNPVILSPEQQMANGLSGLANGTYVTIPNGATVEALAVSNNGEAVQLFADFCNREIAKAILGQTLATEEGKHASRAQAGVHEHSKDDVTRYGQVLLTQMVIQDVLLYLTLANYGPGSERLVPEFGLGQEETMSFADFATGAAALGFSVSDDQFPAMDEMGGLPARDAAAWKSQMELKRRAQEQAAQPQPQEPEIPKQDQPL